MGMVGSRGLRLGLLASVAVCVALAAAGCASNSATPQTIIITPKPGTPGPNDTPTPTLPPPDITHAVISTTAPDSRWVVTFKKPIIGGVPPAAVTKINDAITAKVNTYISAFTSKSLPTPAAGASPSTLDGDFTISLDTAAIVSLRFSILTDVSGDPQPVATSGSLNFNAVSGAAINLGDLFSNVSAALPIITAKTHESLSGTLGDDLKWPTGTVPMTFFDKSWTFVPEGLDFMWSQGSIASSSAGMPSAIVAWPDLKSTIKADGPAGEFVQ